jgi:hypothetical protein
MGGTGQVTLKKRGLLPWTFDTIEQTTGSSVLITHADYGTSDYKVRLLRTSGSGTFNCTVRQHQDTCPNSVSPAIGALWMHTNGGDKNALTGVLLFHEIVWYVPQDRVSILVDYISSNEYLTDMNNILNGTLSISSAAATFAAQYIPYPPIKAVAGIISVLVTLSPLFGGLLDIQQTYIDQIKSCGHFTNTGTIPTYGNGVKLSTYTAVGVGSNGTVAFDIESWYGSAMVGPPGETGTWLANES